MKLMSTILKSLALGGVVFLSGLSGQANAAAIDIAERPLYLQQAKVPPAFIMSVDDSGSMRFQTLFPGFDGTVHWGRDATSGAGNVYSFFYSTSGTGRVKGALRAPATGRQFVQVAPYPAPRNGINNAAGTSNDNAAIPPLDEYGFSRSHVYNPAYFNPSTTYRPWRKYDGNFFEEATPTAARVERNRAANTTTINLTSVFKPTPPGTVDTNNDVRFRGRTGMVIPAGTELYYTTSCGINSGDYSGSGTGWRALKNTVTLTGNCDLYIAYYPATFYLPKDDPAPTGYRTGDTYRPIITNACSFRGATGADQCDMRRYEIKSANYTSVAEYNAAIENFANWFVYYGNRTRAIIAGMTHSLYDVDTMRIGVYTINDDLNTTTKKLTMYDMNIATEKQSLFNFIHAHNSVAGRGTRNLPAVKDMGEQFTRTDDKAPVRLACQINAGMLFTDGFANVDETMTAPSGGMGVPFDTIKDNSMPAIAAEYYLKSLRPDFTNQDLVPVSAGCTAPGAGNNPKLDCKAFPHMNFHAVTLGSFGELIGRTYGVNAAGKIDSDKALDDVIANPPTWPGYVSSNRSTVDDLWHATIVSRGRFINASSPAEITDAMTQILNAVADRASVSGGTAASGTRREDGFLAYVPHFDTATWSGNLKAHELTATGGLGTVKWDASALLASRSLADRKVYFIDDSGTPQEFKAGASLPPSTANSLDKVVADLCPGTTSANTCTRDDVIEYLRGDHSKEVRNGGPFRNRSSRIGDILGSQPEVLTKASYGYNGLPNTMGGPDYAAFMDGAKKTRTSAIYVGSNNGMIHAFNAETGKEIWALIPNAVLKDNVKADGTRDASSAIFADLARPNYDHRYFVDGSPRQGDVFVGGSWKTYLAVPMGAGARSVVVLDVTTGAAQTAPAVIREITGNDIGYGVDRPRIAPLQNKKWAVVFGNGYNSNNNASKLVVHDLAGGSTTVSNAGTGTAADPNGMSGSVATADDDFDGLADRIYAGDYKGDLWKFTVPTSGNIANATRPLFRARDANGDVQRITGGIDVMSHHQRGQIVYFGTGRYLLDADRAVLANPPVDTFYGVWDSTAGAPAATLTRSDLTSQTLSAATTSDGAIIRTTSSNLVPWGAATGNGWYLDLAAGGVAQGERFVGVPTVALGQVIFTTFMPNADSDECAASGINFINAVDAATGSGFLSHGGNTTVGSIRLPDSSSGGGPVATPPVVVTPPPPACDPTTDPDCAPPTPDPDDPSNPTVTPVGAVGCVSNLGILLSDGLLNFAELTCGRQSWRQVE